MKSPIQIPKDHVRPLSIHGMTGRMINITNTDSKRVFIYIHGLHTSAERHYSLCEYLSDFGSVYAPDMPGFGGMDSFYKIGMKPTFDNYADYIYTVVKSLSISEDSQIWFIGLSFGSQVMTRLLQKYPEFTSQNVQAISIVGLASKDDFNDIPKFKFFMYPLMFLGSRKYISKFMYLLLVNPLTLSLALYITFFTSTKMREDKSQRSQIFAMEYNLWRKADFRTHAATAWLSFSQSLSDFTKDKIKLKLHNVSVSGDQYLNSAKVAKSFKKVYQEYEAVELSMDAHAPSLVASKEDVGVMFPEATRKLLSV